MFVTEAREMLCALNSLFLVPLPRSHLCVVEIKRDDVFLTFEIVKIHFRLFHASPPRVQRTTRRALVGDWHNVARFITGLFLLATALESTLFSRNHGVSPLWKSARTRDKSQFLNLNQDKWPSLGSSHLCLCWRLFKSLVPSTTTT